MLKPVALSFWPALLTVTAFAVLCKLGFWQLQRAEQKERFIQAFQQQGNIEISAIVDASEKAQLEKFNGALVSIRGETLMPYMFYVDNKVHQGNVGYSLLMPVRISGSNIAVLVDFGWVQAPNSRALLPNIDIPNNVLFEGQLKTKHLEQFSLEQQTIDDQWPQRIQSPHSALQLDLKEKLLPLIVYAPSNTIDDLTQTYKAVVMPPEKHRAYAVQWFLLAVASLLIFYFAAVKSSSKDNAHES